MQRYSGQPFWRVDKRLIFDIYFLLFYIAVVVWCPCWIIVHRVHWPGCSSGKQCHWLEITFFDCHSYMVLLFRGFGTENRTLHFVSKTDIIFESIGYLYFLFLSSPVFCNSWSINICDCSGGSLVIFPVSSHNLVGDCVIIKLEANHDWTKQMHQL